MTGGAILFWLLAASTCLGAIAVVLSQNVVRMAFWLIVSLGSTAGLFFLLHADFVAATQLLVYVGGTVVLLIFGVMLTASGPYNQLKYSPGNLIAVAATGAAVFFISFMGVKAVDWDRSVLRQVVLSEDKYDEIHHAITDEETDHLLHEAFHSVNVNGTEVYHYAPEEELSSADQKVLLSLLKQNGLTFSPSSETGGTIRPLGFGLLGSRPDKDTNVPLALQRLSNGYFVVKPVPTQPKLQGTWMRIDPATEHGKSRLTFGQGRLELNYDVERADRTLRSISIETPHEQTVVDNTPVVKLGEKPDEDRDEEDGRSIVTYRFDGEYFLELQGEYSPGGREQGEVSLTGRWKRMDISTGYLLPFEIASVHLLVVLIGAAYLARAKRRVEPTL